MNKLLKLSRILRCAAYRRGLFTCWVAAGIEHDRLLRTLDFRTIVDIGANRGQFTLVARQRCPDANVISFEPLPGPARRFRRLFAGDRKVVLHETAIGPAQGTTSMHVSARDDSSSLLPITDLQDKVFPGTAGVGQHQVSVGRLRDFVSRPDIVTPALLKLDVQGYELEALRGCAELLDMFSHVYVECSFMELYTGQALAGEVIDYLHTHGFVHVGPYNAVYNEKGLVVQADLLFARGNGRARGNRSTPGAPA